MKSTEISRNPRYLIDASIYIFGAYFSLPNRWHSPQGLPLNAVYGYTRFLIKFLMTSAAKDIAAAFDESLGSCFRNEIYSNYKCSRELPAEDLEFQLQACRNITELAGIKCFASDRFEADDLIATLARRGREKGSQIIILTRDKDLGQLLQGQDFMWDFTKNKRINAASFKDKYGVSPSQFADYLALTGDQSDDIPGIIGIGPRTASILLENFSGIEEIADNIDEIAKLPIRSAKKIAKKLDEQRKELYLYKRLTRLEDKVPLESAGCLYQPTKNLIESLVIYVEELGLGVDLAKHCSQLKRLCKD